MRPLLIQYNSLLSFKSRIRFISRFQLVQECKYAAGGGESGSNAAPTFKPAQSANAWPYTSHRVRRSAYNFTHADSDLPLLRKKRQGTSYSAGSGGVWQPEPTWGVPKQPQSQLHTSYQSYFQPNRRVGGMGGGGGSAGSSSANAPEKLSKWATQLKFYVSLAFPPRLL